MSLRNGLSSLILLLAAIATGQAQPPESRGVAPELASPPPSPNEIQKLVEQLGAAKFQEREEASSALLKIGEPALLALSTAQRGTDIEIGQRAQAIRQRIEQDQFESISQNFKRDPDPKASYGLPGWTSFSMVAGTSRPAKRLFLKMLERRRILALCLESLDGGTVAPGVFEGLPEDPQARLRAVVGKTCMDIRLDLTTGRDEAYAGDLIALLVAEHRLTEPLQDIHEAIRMECNRGALDRLMSQPGAGPSARKTIGAWFKRAPLNYAGDVFVWGNLAKIPDVSHMARRVLEANPEADLRSRALFLLATYGTVDDLPLIDKYIDDQQVVDLFSPNTNFGDVRVEAQAPPNFPQPRLQLSEAEYDQTIGDIAMAAGGKLAGFDLHALFPAIVIEESVGIHQRTVGFPRKDPELRKKAIDSYKAQRAKPARPAS